MDYINYGQSIRCKSMQSLKRRCKSGFIDTERCLCCVFNKKAHLVPFFLHGVECKYDCKLLCVQRGD